MTVDEIRELIALATESGIAELEVQRGDSRVRIRRSSFTAPPEIVVAAPSSRRLSPARPFPPRPSRRSGKNRTTRTSSW
jgi:acetyl-CoA carboxylase biotin carboxyl carrier protein